MSSQPSLGSLAPPARQIAPQELPSDPTAGRPEHRRLRRRSLIAMLSLVVLLSAAVLFGMELGLRRELSESLASDLERTAAAFRNRLEGAAERLISEGRVVAEEPRLKAAMNAPELDRATLEDVGEELRRAVRWDLLVLLDGEGTVVAACGAEKSTNATAELAQQALGGPETVHYLAAGRRVYQLAALPVAFGERKIGVLVAGYELGDPWTEQFTRYTRALVGLYAGNDLVATSLPHDERLRSEAAAWGGHGDSTKATLGGESFVTRAVPIAGSVRAELFRSEDAALRPYLRLRNAVLIVSAFAALLAIAAAFLVSKGLSQPVAQIESHARQIREMYARLRELDAIIADDLAHAREFQRRLLPELPSARGFDLDVLYRPAAEVGGDVCDIVLLDDGRLRVFVADATGHGVAAALTTLWIKSEYDSVKSSGSPADVLGALHERVRQAQARTGAWFTAIVVDVDVGRKIVRWSAGAHPAPCVFRENALVELESGGSFVGLGEPADFPEWSAALEPNDRVCVFSDGVIDQWNASGKSFGVDGVRTALARGLDDGTAPGRAVEADLERHVGSERAFYDDATLVVVTIGSDFQPTKARAGRGLD